MKGNGGARAFWVSLGISLFLFLTAAGFLMVDSAGRRLTFGDSSPAFQVEKESDGTTDLLIHAMGADAVVDITSYYRIFIFLCDFGCIPHK